MHARTTTVHADPATIDDAIRMVRDEVLGALQAMEGCIGLSMLADRRSGRCIITSAWRDLDSMRSTSDTVTPMRERITRALGGTIDSVQQWEIAVLHRRRPAESGACARVTWTQADPGRAEELTEMYRSQVVPALDDLPGFCGASLMVDRDSGRGVSTVAYESREMLESTRTAADELRNRTVQQMGTSVLEVAEFELVLSELRVPETV